MKKLCILLLIFLNIPATQANELLKIITGFAVVGTIFGTNTTSQRCTNEEWSNVLSCKTEIATAALSLFVGISLGYLYFKSECEKVAKRLEKQKRLQALTAQEHFNEPSNASPIDVNLRKRQQ